MSPSDEVHEYLGIDFGTSNSYFTICKVLPQKLLDLRDLTFADGRSSLPTCKGMFIPLRSVFIDSPFQMFFGTVARAI